MPVNNIKKFLEFFNISQKELVWEILLNLDRGNKKLQLTKYEGFVPPQFNYMTVEISRVCSGKNKSLDRIKQIGEALKIDYRLLLPPPDYNIDGSKNESAIKEVYIAKAHQLHG